MYCYWKCSTEVGCGASGSVVLNSGMLLWGGPVAPTGSSSTEIGHATTGSVVVVLSSGKVLWQVGGHVVQRASSSVRKGEPPALSASV
eukprot:2336672-Rhodomonas_salina.1